MSGFALPRCATRHEHLLSFCVTINCDAGQKHLERDTAVISLMVVCTAAKYSTTDQACQRCQSPCHPGWLNLLLKYMWPGFVSNIATSLTVNQLNNLFERLSRMLSGMPIFRVVFSQLVLRELSLGATPPRFANGTVR